MDLTSSTNEPSTEKISVVFLVVESNRVIPLELDSRTNVAELKKILHSGYGKLISLIYD
jgi:hypothetical protein